MLADRVFFAYELQEISQIEFYLHNSEMRFLTNFFFLRGTSGIEPAIINQRGSSLLTKFFL